MMCRGGRSKGAMIVKLAATSAASADDKMGEPAGSRRRAANLFRDGCG